MDYRKINEEVFYNITPSVAVSCKDIAFLKERALETGRRRSRLCTHGTPEDPLHEMFIVHHRGAYVRPHKHLDKRESFHLIEGSVDMVLFHDDGTIAKVIPMGDYASGKHFYNRIASSCYHTLIIRSEVLVFHETTTGPFRREDMVFAPWSPAEADTAEVEAYLKRLEESIGRERPAIDQCSEES